MRYRISWRVKDTQATGHGRWYEEREEIEPHIAGLNKRWKGQIDHWIEEQSSYSGTEEHAP